MEYTLAEIKTALELSERESKKLLERVRDPSFDVKSVLGFSDLDAEIFDGCRNKFDLGTVEAIYKHFASRIRYVIHDASTEDVNAKAYLEYADATADFKCEPVRGSRLRAEGIPGNKGLLDVRDLRDDLARSGYHVDAYDSYVCVFFIVDGLIEGELELPYLKQQTVVPGKIIEFTLLY